MYKAQLTQKKSSVLFLAHTNQWNKRIYVYKAMSRTIFWWLCDEKSINFVSHFTPLAFRFASDWRDTKGKGHEDDSKMKFHTLSSSVCGDAISLLDVWEKTKWNSDVASFLSTPNIGYFTHAFKACIYKRANGGWKMCCDLQFYTLWRYKSARKLLPAARR